MNKRIAAILNPILAIFGRKIVERRIGHWSGNPLRRTTYPIGWRFARLNEPEGATELDRFWAAHKDEIRARTRTAAKGR